MTTTGAVSLRQFSAAAVKSTSNTVCRAMERLDPSVFDRARNTIAGMSGYRDFATFKRKQLGYQQDLLDISTISRKPEHLHAFTRMLAYQPDNYENRLDEFGAIDTVQRLLFDRPPLGIHLGSNFGTYLYYLKYSRGFDRFFGIDPDRSATRGAKEIGVTVIPATAHALPFRDNSLDLVVTHYLLEIHYCSLLQTFLNPSPLPSPSEVKRKAFMFRNTALAEIARVLRPGGWYISDGDFSSALEIMGSLPEDLIMQLGLPEQIREEVAAQLFGFSRLFAFHKPQIPLDSIAA